VSIRVCFRSARCRSRATCTIRRTSAGRAQPHDEPCTWLTGFVTHVTIHRLCQSAHDRQPQAGAACLAGGTGAGLGELLEQPRPELFWYASTAVGDDDLGILAIA